MKGRRLQLTGYRASDYARPGDRWTCGRDAAASPCPLGPTSRGVCGAACTPSALPGGGYACGHPGGLACAEGPLVTAEGARCSQVPCQPRPSLRRVRGLLSVGVTLLTIALLTAALAHPGTRDAVTSPGPLSVHHAALACADCHTAALSSGALAWAEAALRPGAVGLEPAKCAACHGLDGPSATLAHTLEQGALEGLQERARARWAEAPGPRPEPGLVLQGALALAERSGLRGPHGYAAAHQIDCGSCHTEHQGRDAALVDERLETRCHVCHTTSFDAFDAGHPEFTSFGVRRPPGTGIFTHWRHYRDRFGAEPLACTDCHALDERGRHVRVRPETFDTQCTRCHQHRLNLAPLPLLSAPTGPVLAWLADLERRPAVEEVPELEPTALSRLLLPEAQHDKAQRSLKLLRNRLRSLLREAPADTDGDGRFSAGDGLEPKDLAKLRKLTDEAAQAADYTAALRGLVKTLAAGDLAPVRAALGLGEQADLAGLQAVLPREALAKLDESWWAPSGGPAARRFALGAPANLGGAWQGRGEWAADDEGGGLRYQGYTHADPFLRAWLELAPRMPAGPQQDALFEALAERCGKCHVDPALPPGERLQWTSQPAQLELDRRLTHFAHGAHLPFEQDCTACHQLPEAEPARGASDFVLAPAWRTRGELGPNATGCLECHQRERYDASCQVCHDYHAGARAPAAGVVPRVR